MEGLTKDTVQFLTLAGSPLLAAALAPYRSPAGPRWRSPSPSCCSRAAPGLRTTRACSSPRLCCVTGIVDDHLGLRAGIKSALQIAAAPILIYFNYLTIDPAASPPGAGTHRSPSCASLA